LIDKSFEKVKLTNQSKFYGDTVVYEDIYRVLNLSEENWEYVAEKGFAKPYDERAYWIKFSIDCRNSGEYFLENQYPMLEEYSLYIKNKTINEVYHQGNLGIKNKQLQNVKYSSPVFKFGLEAGNEYEFFIFINKRFSTSALPIYLRSAENFSEHLSNSERKRGIVYGIFIFLIFQALIMWFYLKLNIYLHYLFYALGLFFILIISDGTFRLILSSKNHEIGYFALYYSILLSFNFLYLILFKILKTKELLPKIYTWITFKVALSFLVLLINTFAFFYIPQYPLLLFKVSNLLIALYPVLFIVVCIATYIKNRNAESLIFLGMFALTLFFILSFAFLPFANYVFEKFMLFKWLIVFEGILVLVIVNRDLYLSKLASIQLKDELLAEREKVANNYLEGLSDERKRVAQQLHDIISVKLAGLKHRLLNDNINEKNKQKLLLNEINDLHEEVRNISHTLSPIVLENKGLEMVLEEFIIKLEDICNNIFFDYSITLSQSITDKKIEEFLYFTFMELINNTLKHSQADVIKIVLNETNKNYILMIEDNGIGYNYLEVINNGIGLKSIRQRADLLNGEFSIIQLPKGVKHIFKINKT
jgi:two-component system, sensor histidine kinase LadS